MKYSQKLKLSPKAVEIVKKIEKFLKVVSKDLSISPPKVRIFTGSAGLIGAEGYKTNKAIHLRERSLYGWGSLHHLVCHEFAHYIDTEMSDSEIIDKITGTEFKESRWRNKGGRPEKRANWISKNIEKKYLEEWNNLWRGGR